MENVYVRTKYEDLKGFKVFKLSKDDISITQMLHQPRDTLPIIVIQSAKSLFSTAHAKALTPADTSNIILRKPKDPGLGPTQ